MYSYNTKTTRMLRRKKRERVGEPTKYIFNMHLPPLLLLWSDGRRPRSQGNFPSFFPAFRASAEEREGGKYTKWGEEGEDGTDGKMRCAVAAAGS